MENEKGLDFPENGKRKMENGKSSFNVEEMIKKILPWKNFLTSNENFDILSFSATQKKRQKLFAEF